MIIFSKQFILKQLEPFMKPNVDLTKTKANGVAFASDVCLYLAIMDFINNEYYNNERRVFEKVKINTFDDFINVIKDYHGQPAKEVVTIYNIFNLPLLFIDIHNRHLEYLKEFPYQKINAFFSKKYIPNILNGTKYFLETLDDIEKITLINSMIKLLSKEEMVDEIIGDVPEEIKSRIINNAKIYTASGIPEDYKNLDDMFTTVGVLTFNTMILRYIQIVPLSESHYRATAIKDKCNEIIGGDKNEL